VRGLLVRVAIDQTPRYGGWNAPVNTQSRRFLYVPIIDSYNDPSNKLVTKSNPAFCATLRNLGRLRLLFPSFFLLLCLTFAPALRADTITGTINDPSGAVVAGARIEISGGSLSQPTVLVSDEIGKFTATNLTPGKYLIRVSKEGFEGLEKLVDLQGTADLQLGLRIAAQQTSINVSGKSAAFANSDAVYRQLRDIGLVRSYHCEKFTLKVDVGVFELKSGTITLVGGVNNFVTGAIFIGQGHFTLKPFLRLDTQELNRRSGNPEVEEDFTEAVFRFSGGMYPQLAAAFGSWVDTSAEATTVFQRWRNKVRHRHDVPEGFTQGILEDATIDNVDADILAAVYNPKHPPFFNAYMTGSPHKDLRFFVRSRVGAIPQMDSPEEVALINCNGSGMDDGIWYSEHLLSELKAKTASSQEDRRLFATRRYNIETVIGKNNHLFSRATIAFSPLVPGERVLKFGLLPTLRVQRVSDLNGQDLHFIQEDRKQDGSFYVILDEAPPLDRNIPSPWNMSAIKSFRTRALAAITSVHAPRGTCAWRIVTGGPILPVLRR
jgi:hypothetical protein